MINWLGLVDWLDRSVFTFINAGWQNGFFDWLMPWLSQPLATAPFFIWAAYVLWRRDEVDLTWLLGFIGLLLLTDALVGNWIRPWLGRPRPYAALIGIHVYDNHWFVTDQASVKAAADSFGFPSIHATNSFGLAGHYFFRDRRVGAWLIGLAGLIACSRIYLGVHYPLDVLAGAAWGIGSAWLISRIRFDRVPRRRWKLPG